MCFSGIVSLVFISIFFFGRISGYFSFISIVGGIYSSIYWDGFWVGFSKGFRGIYGDEGFWSMWEFIRVLFCIFSFLLMKVCLIMWVMLR